MLKSLGQWTSPIVKTRKIIPSKLTVVPSKPPPSHEGQGEQHDNAVSTRPYQQLEIENVEAEYVAVFI